MKVRLTVTVELDPRDWASEYGTPLEEVREDVRDYFTNQLNQAPAISHAGLTVRIV